LTFLTATQPQLKHDERDVERRIARLQGRLHKRRSLGEHEVHKCERLHWFMALRRD